MTNDWNRVGGWLLSACIVLWALSLAFRHFRVERLAGRAAQTFMHSPKRYSGGSALPTIPDPKPVPSTNEGTWTWDRDTEGFNPQEPLPQGAIALLGTTRFYHSDGYAGCLRLSPNGTLLAVGFENGRYVVFETRTGEVSKTSQRGAEIRSLAFSPTGDAILAGRNDGAIEILELQTGKVGQFKAARYDSIEDVAWSGDGDRFADAAASGRVRVRKRDATVIREIETGGLPKPIGLSRSGRFLATTHKQVDVWDVESGQSVWSQSGSFYFAFAKNRDSLFLVDYNGEGIREIELPGGRELRKLHKPVDINPLLPQPFDPDAGALFAIRNSEPVNFDAATGQVTPVNGFASNRQPFRRLPFYQNSPVVADAPLVAGDAGDGHFLVWNFHTGQVTVPLYRLVGSVERIRFLGDSGRVLTDDVRNVHLWEVRTGKHVGQARMARGGNGLVPVESEHKLFSFGKRTEPQASKMRWDLLEWDFPAGKIAQEVTGVGSTIRYLQGKLAAIASDDGTIGLYRRPEWSEVGRLRVHDGLVAVIGTDREGRRLVSINDDGTVGVWDVTSQTRLWQFSFAEGRSGSPDRSSAAAVFSPSGRQLAVLGGDRWSAAIWDLTNGRQSVLDQSDEIEAQHVQTVAIGFAAERPLIARAVTFDEPQHRVVIRVKNLQTGRVTRTYTIPDDYATAVMFSPDGQLLAVGSSNGNTLIYETGVDAPDTEPTPAAR